MRTSLIIRSLSRQLAFSLAIAERDLRGLYHGSLLGIGWLFLRPLIHAAGYVLIIIYVLRVKPGGDASPIDYTLHVLAGLTAWQPLQRCLEEAPSLIRERMEVLRQVVYPIETLPISSVLISLIPASMTFLVYSVVSLLQAKLPWSVILLPLPIALLIVVMIGASWIFMVVGTVMRDLREVVAVIMGVLVFLSPVVLTPEMTGDGLWGLILINPLAHVVLCFRDVLQGSFHPASWIIFAAIAAGFFLGGAWLLARVKLMLYELM
jgi:lipopolysaccharide transport system permease protein